MVPPRFKKRRPLLSPTGLVGAAFAPPSPPGCLAGPHLHGAGGKDWYQATRGAERDSQQLRHLGGSERRRGDRSALPLPGERKRMLSSPQLSWPDLPQSNVLGQGLCWCDNNSKCITPSVSDTIGLRLALVMVYFCNPFLTPVSSVPHVYLCPFVLDERPSEDKGCGQFPELASPSFPEVPA